MNHPVSPDTHPSLGGLHAGWASFGGMLTGTVPTGDAPRAGHAGWLRGLIRRLGNSSHSGRDFADMPAYLLDDIGLDPRDARPEPLLTESSDAAMWVGIKTGMLPRL